MVLKHIPEHKHPEHGVIGELNSKALMRFVDVKQIIVQSWTEDMFGFVFYTKDHGNIQVIFNKSTGKIEIYEIKQS